MPRRHIDYITKSEPKRLRRKKCDKNNIFLATRIENTPFWQKPEPTIKLIKVNFN